MKKSKLIIGAFGMINAALIASLGMSLAWYVNGDILTVSGINITFRGDKEVTAGLTDDETTFGSTIIFNDEENNKNYYPVSSMFSDEWINAKAPKPQFRDGYSSIDHNNVDSYTKSSLITVDEDGYFSKEIYLYCEASVVLTIDSEGTSFTPDKAANRNTAKQRTSDEDEIAAYEAELNKVTDSLRFSVLIPDENEYQYYIIDPHKKNETYLCGIMNYDHDTDAYYDSYYSGTEEYEYFYGEYNDESLLVYDVASATDSEIEGGTTADMFHARHKAGVRPVNLVDSIANGFIPKKENSLSLDEADISKDVGQANGVRIKIRPYEVTKIVLSLYLEGWDRDNTSIVEQGKFNADIKFKIGEEFHA